jgi:membrane-bound lytic murein transglycosylase D
MHFVYPTTRVLTGTQAGTQAGQQKPKKTLKFFIAPALAVLLSSCVHPRFRSDASGVPLQPGERIIVNSDSPEEVQSFRVTDPVPPKVLDNELESIPTEINEKVDQWVKYFQGKGRPHMERYLARSGRYMKVMQNILKKNGLPDDLIYIALIESGFSSKATSHASAVGYWQFIRGTGKRYGLEINGLVDERRDPILATQAAAEYFKGLYSVFGSWYLAMASYNVGENRVKREVMNHYTRDFWELARKRRFPRETINYIPKFIAAKMIGNDPQKYGFTDIEWEKPLEFETIKVDRPVNLKQMAAKMNFDYDDLKQMNPKFRGEIAPTKKTEHGPNLELRVPVGQTVVALAAAKESSTDRVEFIADAGDTIIHKVRSGESLYSIARKYRSTVALIRDLNDIKAGRKLRIGMRLQVPERGSRRASAAVRAGRKKSKPAEVVETKVASEQATEQVEVSTSDGKFYVVQPGDTLSGIADDYDSTVNELRQLNKIRRGKILKIGMRIKVPGDDKGIPVAPDSDQVVPSRGPQAIAPIAHIVKPGETLTSIAQKYGVSVSSLQRANKLKSKSLLRIGVRLVIPLSANREVWQDRAARSARGVVQPTQRRQSRKYHVVKRGESLGHIAERYSVSLSALRSKNKIASGSKLFVGVKLLIPSANAASR